jgi:hypothetical protein
MAFKLHDLQLTHGVRWGSGFMDDYVTAHAFPLALGHGRKLAHKSMEIHISPAMRPLAHQFRTVPHNTLAHVWDSVPESVGVFHRSHI